MKPLGWMRQALKDAEKSTKNLPKWLQKKITLAALEDKTK